MRYMQMFWQAVESYRKTHDSIKNDEQRRLALDIERKFIIDDADLQVPHVAIFKWIALPKMTNLFKLGSWQLLHQKSNPPVKATKKKSNSPFYLYLDHVGIRWVSELRAPVCSKPEIVCSPDNFDVIFGFYVFGLKRAFLVKSNVCGPSYGLWYFCATGVTWAVVRRGPPVSQHKNAASTQKNRVCPNFCEISMHASQIHQSSQISDLTADILYRVWPKICCIST